MNIYNRLKPSVFLSALFFNLLFMSGAYASDIEMADKLREDGKIWVVVTTIVIILLGILLYLIRLEKKISLIEQNIKKSHPES